MKNIGRVSISPARVALRRMDMTQKRLCCVACVVALCFLILIARLTSVMVLQPTNEGDTVTRDMPPSRLFSRANIRDRNGEILATNLHTGSLYANPKEILDAQEAAKKLHHIFQDLSLKELQSKLASERSFIWLKRHLTPKQHQAIYQAGIPGVYIKNEERRLYPHGKTTGHVVGYTDIDMLGLSGVEKYFNSSLSTDGSPLELAIDIRVQDIVREELQKGVEEFSALHGSGLVMDVETGEIIAMVALPDFDPHYPDKKRLFNQNTLGVYEMGSTFKILTLAMALDSGKISLSDGYDTTYNMKIGKHTIKDHYGKKRWLSVPEIFMYSSNIGTSKMVLDIGKENQYTFFRRMGFFEKVPFELPELGTPIVPSEWRDINAITASYGYGIAISPLHLASAVAAVVNGGILRPPTLLKQEKSPEGTRVLKRTTSDKMRRLLRTSVQHGTCRKSAVKGYLVGAKTGSANRSYGASTQRGKLGYRNKHFASVAAAFPMTKPQYLLLLTLDEPTGTKETFGFSTGGWTVAPIVRRVIQRIGPALDVKPIAEDTREVQLAMQLPPVKNDKRFIG